MASQILDKFAADAAMNITLASLASSSAGVGRQSDLVDNTVNRYPRVIVEYKIKQGTGPTGNKAVYFYLLRADTNGTQHIDGGAGTADAAWTAPPNLTPVFVAGNKASPSSGDVLQGSF